MRNEYRTNQVRAEVAEIQRQIDAAEEKKKFEADRPAREAAAQQAEHERRELKRRLLLDPAESQDFTGYKKYDGRFPDAASVEKAIRESWVSFNENHSLDSQAQNTVTLFLQLHPLADITLPETFENAHAYLESKLCPPQVNTAVPVQVAPVAAQATYGDGSPVSELDAETVGSPIFLEACQSICDSSDKPMSGLEAKRLYRHFAENSGNSGRRYGRMTVATIRRAARDLWSDALVGLTPEEAQAKEESRVWESLPATEARRALKIPLESNRQPVVAYHKQESR